MRDAPPAAPPRRATSSSSSSVSSGSSFDAARSWPENKRGKESNRTSGANAIKVHREEDGRYIVSLARGDSIRESLESLASDEGIVGARLSAIGAIEDPELGLYDFPTQSYFRRDFPGIWELLCLEGNISLLEGAPFLHAHITISGHDYKVYGGHLFDARVAVVFECFVEPVSTPLPRVACPAIGLPRWEPGDEV